MCEFCTKHGEGKKWYENISNYTEEVFRKVNSEERFKVFLKRFPGTLKKDIPRANIWKKHFPRIYNLIAYPLITRLFKAAHFGQIVPLEDIELILSNFNTVVRLPCICRKIVTGREKRYCFGIGMDLTSILKESPDFSDLEKIPMSEALQLIRDLDTEGFAHSIWTLGTPYIGSICNCDRDCIAYRSQLQLKTFKVMWKAEYVAQIDPAICTGCRQCVPRCYYDALSFDKESGKCVVNQKSCYGCGLCRPVCKKDAVALLDRKAVPEVANDW